LEERGSASADTSRARQSDPEHLIDGGIWTVWTGY